MKFYSKRIKRLNAEIFWNSKMSDDYTGYVEKIFEEKKNK